MTLQELEARLRTLEDIGKINKLQRAYGYYLEHWEEPQIVDLFSHSANVSIDISGGVYIGQEGIKRFFLTDKLPSELLHAFMQLSGIVDVDPSGKTAKGRWYGFGPLAVPMEGVVRAIWSFGVYENEYVKEGGKWKFKKLCYNRIFNSPYEDGWVKNPAMTIHFRHFPKAEPATNINKSYPSGYVFPYHYKNPVSDK